MNDIKYKITYMRENIETIQNNDGDYIDFRSLRSGSNTYYVNTEEEAISSLRFDLNNRFVVTDIEKFKNNIRVEKTLFDERNTMYEMKHR